MRAWKHPFRTLIVCWREKLAEKLNLPLKRANPYCVTWTVDRIKESLLGKCQANETCRRSFADYTIRQVVDAEISIAVPTYVKSGVLSGFQSTVGYILKNWPADIAQYGLECVGFTKTGKLTGAMGNIVTGGIAGGPGGAISGGILWGLGEVAGEVFKACCWN